MNLLNESSQSRKVNGISAEETLRIKDFLQGAVYCWCKNNKGEWFSLRDLMGGQALARQKAQGMDLPIESTTSLLRKAC